MSKIFIRTGLFVCFCLLLVSSAWAQENIQGVVKDTDGNPIIGAAVVEKGTNNGQSTDMTGRFSIRLQNPQSVVTVSFIGYATLELAAQPNMEIVLEEETQALDEVVEVGYGTARRRDITGATASVSSEALMARTPTSIEQALAGQVAGVLVSQGNGFDTSPSIRIRGNRSIGANNDPLFVVDGIPVWGGVNSINPADIQSIEVLKDASATAIYGVRGANGVILVTSKRGEEGRIQVEYQGSLSIGKFSDRFREVYDAAEYVEYVRESNRSYPDRPFKVRAANIAELQAMMERCKPLKPSIVEVRAKDITPEFRSFCRNEGIRTMALETSGVVGYRDALLSGAEMIFLDRPEIFQQILSEY